MVTTKTRHYCMLCLEEFKPGDVIVEVEILDTWENSAHESCALANKTAVEIDRPPTIQGETMAEPTDITETVVDIVEPVPTRLETFVTKHPRAARALAITGVVTSAIGVVQVTRTIQANKNHLNAVGDHASAAAAELNATVTPQSTEA